MSDSLFNTPAGPLSNDQLIEVTYTPSEEYIKTCKRKQLLALCKENGIKAVGTNAQLQSQLLEKLFGNAVDTENHDDHKDENVNVQQQTVSTELAKSVKTSPIAKLKSILKKPSNSVVSPDKSLNSHHSEYKPFSTFSQMFAERSTPLAKMKVKQPEENLERPLPLRLNLVADPKLMDTPKPSASISKESAVREFKDAGTMTVHFDVLNDLDDGLSSIMSALDNPIPLSNADINEGPILKARCVVDGKFAEAVKSRWALLVLKRGLVYLYYQNISRPFLFAPHELAHMDLDEDEFPDNMVCPRCVEEHDERMLHEEIRKMRISKAVDSPLKNSSPRLSSLRSPAVYSNSPKGTPVKYGKVPIMRGDTTVARAFNTSASANPFSFSQNQQEVFQPKHTLLRSPYQ